VLIVSTQEEDKHGNQELSPVGEEGKGAEILTFIFSFTRQLF
jgi:hypothetical protein